MDSILIDEARTPLIISGPAEDSSDLYRSVDIVVAEMVKDATTYDKDEKFRTVILTEHGTETVEAMLRDAGIVTEGGLYDVFNVSVVHHVQQSLRAHTLFSRDVDYIVRDGQGRDHRRVHRPHDGGPPLRRRAAPGAGGQGARRRSSRKTRRWRPSPSRTTSGCTPSCPA